jgi:hypothetical protein
MTRCRRILSNDTGKWVAWRLKWLKTDHAYPVLLSSLLDFTDGLVRHDPLKVKELIESILAQE